MIDNRHIQHAIVLAEHRNFARAAEALQISQPALTRSIQVLEQRLGVRLFDRLPRDVIPTEFGRLLIERGQNILSATHQLRRELDLLRGVQTGELRIGISPMEAQLMLGPTAGKIAETFPQVTVSVKLGPWTQMQELLLAGDLDVFVGDLTGADIDEELEVIELEQVQATFYCRPGHPVCMVANPTLADILSYPLALTSIQRKRLEMALELDPQLAQSMDTLLEDAMFHQCDDPRANQDLVSFSDTIGMAHPRAVQAPGATSRVIPLTIADVNLPCRTGVVFVHRRTLAPSTLRFIDYAEQFHQAS